LGRIIGLIGGACLLITVVRLTGWQHGDLTLQGGVEVAEAQSKLSPRDAYRTGKELYLRGKYEQALPLLQQATEATSGLTKSDRQQANQYLDKTQTRLAEQAVAQPRSRGQSPEGNSPVADATRTRVERLMSMAIQAARRGNTVEAKNLAQQAHQIARTSKMTFAQDELSPVQLLTQLNGGSPFSKPKPVQTAAATTADDIPEWARDGSESSPTNSTSSIQLVNADQSDNADFAQAVESTETAPSTKPAGSDEFAESMESAEFGAENPTNTAHSVTPATPAKAEELAARLIREARADIKALRFDEARTKALEADKLDVVYDLFDDRPELVLAEVDRRTGSVTVARNSTSAKPRSGASVSTGGAAQPFPDDAELANSDAPGSPRSAASPSAARTAKIAGSKAEAMKLLELARQDLKNGQLQAAQDKATQAQQMNVAYKLFEDRPEMLLNDIAAAMAAANVAQAEGIPGDEAGSVSGGAKSQALALLAQARETLGQGRIDEARQLAIEAERLKASYGLFDDRPDIVLTEIARAAARSASGQEAPLTPDSGRPSADMDQTDEPTVASNLAPREQARQLLAQARQLMQQGEWDAAKAKAMAADQIGAAFGVIDDRPDLVLADIEQAIQGNVVDSRPVPAASELEAGVMTADVQADPTGDQGFSPAGFDPAFDQSDTVSEIRPTGASALDLYNQGMAHLTQGDREQAYQSFLAAYQSGQRLDAFRQQRMQDFLRDLRPRAAQPIQLTNSQVTDSDLVQNADAELSPLDAVAQQQSVKFDRLRSETVNAVFRAERLRAKDPEQSLQIIDQAMASVEGAELSEEASASLLKSLLKTRTSLQNEIARQEPNLEQKRRNEEVLSSLERDQQAKIRVEQEFAKLVEEFNTLSEQKRFAEAEVLAKKAKELDPKNPVAETLFWKARFQRRVASNEELKLNKEEAIWKMLDEVEQAAYANVGDDPITFGKDWKDISGRRDKNRRAGTRELSEEEIKIEQSLDKRISLHEDNVPLAEVIKKIAEICDINIIIDPLGLEDAEVTSNELVSISVDGIKVKSALNLILDQFGLGYMVQDEVLKVTSKLRQQGDLIVDVYDVADLVVPVSTFINSLANQNGSTASGGLGGGQMSIGPNGIPLPGQPFAQVMGDPFANLATMPGATTARAGAAAKPDFDSLVDLVTTTIAPETWYASGGAATIKQDEGTLSLIIRQTQQVHSDISDLLTQLRKLQDLQVTIEVRFVTVSDRFFERIGIDFDFNLQDTVGGADVDNSNVPLLPFGSVLIPQGGSQGVQGQQGQQGGGGGQLGQQGQQGQQGQLGGGNAPFNASPGRELSNRDQYPRNNTIVGLASPNQFSQDLDVPFRQGSFEVGVPQFGGFNPSAGAQIGLAILSDIEAFFFIQAAQGDQRSNLMFAPKITLFNGMPGSVQSGAQRFFVTSSTPVVGNGVAGNAVNPTPIFDGITLQVIAVISADRRYVRLAVNPQFQNVTDVQTFSTSAGVGFGGFGGGGGGIGGGGIGGGGIGGGGIGGGGGGGGIGGAGFGIGGGMGSAAMVMDSLIAQGFGGGGFGGGGVGGGGVGGGGLGGQQGGQQGQQGNAGLITVQLPVVETVNVTTAVSVPDGGTVLLGGVKRLREGRNMAGVPILNKIPYISRLFKNTGVGRETESLMLMVTPRIIINAEEEELLGIPTE
jgi:general secretion pathway protein D